MDTLIWNNLVVKDNTIHWLRTNKYLFKKASICYKPKNEKILAQGQQIFVQNQQRPVQNYNQHVPIQNPL